eukprot:16610-Chlamydomonas_euryale.AAC.7
MKLRADPRNIKDFSGMYSTSTRACHEEGSGDIRATAAEHPLDGQAQWVAIKNLAPSECMEPQQVGRMIRSCARRGGSD